MININLLPPEIKQRIIQAKKSANIFGICLTVLIAFIVFVFLVNSAKTIYLDPTLSYNKEQAEKKKNGSISYQEVEAKALFINSRAQLTKTIEAKKPVWSEILTGLINCVPQTVRFESLNINSEKMPNFVLNGKADSETEIIKFKDKLEASIFFKNVKFKSSSLTQSVSSTADAPKKELEFSLEFNLENLTSSKTDGNKEGNEKP